MSISSTCAAKPVIQTKSTTVSVNGIAIARAAIAQEIQNHPAPTPVEAWKSAARALVVRELLLQEALRLGIKAEPARDAAGRRESDDEALINALVDREVTVPSADESTCRRYYEHNLRRFRSPDIFEVSHILLAAAPDDIAGRSAAKAQAEVLIENLVANPSGFAAVALTHSACPSREVGGNLGQIGPGQTVLEFEDALASMAVGTVHDSAVESRYGLHVVRVNRRETGRQLRFEIVQERIAEYLNERVHRTAVRQYISLLAGQAAIEGIEFALAQCPLVQ